MIPRLLSEWTLDALLNLLAMGIHESEDFDLKQNLPPSGDVGGKDRLKAACAAFANASGGGFLIFGVADDRELASYDRLIGCDRALDFPVGFGDYPRLLASVNLRSIGLS